MKYQNILLMVSLNSTVAKGVSPVPLMSPIEITNLYTHMLDRGTYTMVTIHQAQSRATQMAITIGTKMIRNSSATKMAAVFMTAMASLILLNMQMKITREITNQPAIA